MNRTWKEVKGLFTPGGDSCWECPVCGKSRHVYGIESMENYKTFCDNCKISLQYPWEYEIEKIMEESES